MIRRLAIAAAALLYASAAQAQLVLPGGGGGSSLATPVSGANGGTGVANTGSTVTLGASITTTGAGAPTLVFPATPQTYTFCATSCTIAPLASPVFTGAVSLPLGVSGVSAGLVFTGDAAGWYRNAANQWTWMNSGFSSKISIISGLFRLDSATSVVWTPSNSEASADAGIARAGIGIMKVTDGGGGDGALQIGATALTLAANEFGLHKITASGSAPGASGGKLALVCGTNAGTAKLIAYAGTSTTPVTILDNIGSGVTGC